MSGLSAEDGPYPGKSIAEIVHDYAVIRGDLSEQYARDQLVAIIERRILAARAAQPDAGTALAEVDIQSVLAAHELTLHTMVSTIGVCGCDDWRKGGLDADLIADAHRAHVAAAIRAALTLPEDQP